MHDLVSTVAEVINTSEAERPLHELPIRHTVTLSATPTTCAPAPKARKQEASYARSSEEQAK